MLQRNSGRVKRLLFLKKKRKWKQTFFFALPKIISIPQMNRTESGPYEMVRGRENIKELGHIVSYKGQKSMSYRWAQDKYCGQLNGSDASVYPPIDESDVPDKLYTFEPEVCRYTILYTLFGVRRFNNNNCIMLNLRFTFSNLKLAYLNCKITNEHL